VSVCPNCPTCPHILWQHNPAGCIKCKCIVRVHTTERAQPAPSAIDWMRLWDGVDEYRIDLTPVRFGRTKASIYYLSGTRPDGSLAGSQLIARFTARDAAVRAPEVLRRIHERLASGTTYRVVNR
jgi:hypothetical protein